jgi:colanic acid/amylovoran biosynthesis glycosyltransferase
VIEDYPTFIINEIRWLRRFGARVTLFSAFRPEPQADPDREVFRRESLYFPPGYRGVVTANLVCLLTRPLAYLRSLLLIRREGESLRLLLLAGWFARTVRREGIQHLHGTFGTRTTTLAWLIAQLSGRDYSFTTHAYDIFRHNPSLVWKTNDARFMRTISQFNKRYIEEVYRGTDPSRIRVVYLGVDTGTFVPLPNGTGQPHSVQFLAVGSLIEQKGHIILLRACRLLLDQGHQLSCQIIGEGDKRPVIEDELARLGLGDTVRLLGTLPHEEVRQRLQAADVFVLPCIDLRSQDEHIDGLPVALMEAMAMGKPVVSTAISGIPELIDPGVSGLLVPEKDVERLAGALTLLLNDQELRARLGAAARKRVQDRFDLGLNVRELATLYTRNSGALRQ